MVKIMTDKKRNVPKLRFRGFTETWEQRSLGDYADLKGRIGFRGYTRNDIIPKEKGGILTFSPTNIINGQINNNSKNTYITELKYNESPEIKVKNNDILFVKTGSTLGKSSLVENLQEPATINPQIVIIKSKVGNEHFLAIYLQTAQLLRQVHALKIGGAVPTLTEAEIKTFTINIPKAKAEASQISALFNRLDKLIALHQRKQNQLKKVKKALLQKMFADEKNPFPFIRFKGFTEAWEQRKLGEVSTIVGGGTPSTKNSAYWGGTINWYSPAEIDDQIYVNNSQRKITELGLSKSSASLLPIGTVLFTSRAGIGKTAILGKKACTNQGFQSIIPNKKELDSYFVYTMTAQLKRYGETHGAGSTFVEVSGKQMAKMPVVLPKYEEQIQISFTFKQLDSLVALHQRKLDQLQKLKKSLLQNMFI